MSSERGDLERLLGVIALEHMRIETLETRRMDSLDFHEVSVWGVRAALQAAYEAGRNAALPSQEKPARRAGRTRSR